MVRPVATLGLDIAKTVFQVHGVDAAGQVVIRQRLTRGRVLAFFEKLAPCLVGMEACGSSHYWARELTARGHEVRLMPAQYVKPYVKRSKNDAADAEAICEAVTRPTMRFVPMGRNGVADGARAGGIEVIHTPGHCAGQVALLWRPGRMLFAGDVCTNIMGLGDPVGFENLEEGRASQRKLASLSFDAAGFGHGKPIARNASACFRNKWGEQSSGVRNRLPDMEDA